MTRFKVEARLHMTLLVVIRLTPHFPRTRAEAHLNVMNINVTRPKSHSPNT